MSRHLLTGLVLPLLASLAFAGNTVTIETAKGAADVPFQPERIAVFDWAALDTLDRLGIKAGVTTKPVFVDYLAPLFARAEQVGSWFEPDIEALVAYQPQLIITGGPGAAAFDALAEVAPTIDMTIADDDIRVSGEARMAALAKVFGKQAEAAALTEEIEQSFAATRAAAQGIGNGLVLSITGQKVSAFGTKSRLSSWIHQDIGVAAVDEALSNAGHGQPVSFEYIAEQNPDWLFVLDRTSAMGQDGASAREVLDNPLVRQTTAWQKGQVVYMPNANYIVAGGVTQLLNASEQLHDAFAAAKQEGAQ